ncbi:MAG: DNA replication/repair protein RecF [Candidatus Izemoplasmatales bacterium]|jgi:DNA replication and repair protein RecF|nr:DNA replication/repair protein RecF [Candidatus Izemoplasmatales bacterium]MDD5601908.1 DNA replication/repair protein RecF [Candidatus Izemoplasmatales bacterium]MDY0372980.1 DNA replication/repair protein RecF [Candidatus Izemoplasmatales bacterium]NLF48028.1 DNA replication/repair protein RecF [Acholeplasmataceae bacterium]
MMIQKITLTNFRNYQKQTLTLGSGIHFIIGANGAGKTNLLEALYVLSLAKSYKVEDADLIRYTCDFAKIQASVASQNRQIDLSLIITEIGKKALLNDHEIKRLSDYIGNLHIVSFLPEDMSLIKGSPGDRRYYFDVFLSQIDKNYLEMLTTYKYTLRQRNELLKKLSAEPKPDTTLLDVLTEQLAFHAQQVMARRDEFVKEINDVLNSAYKRLAHKNEMMSMTYCPSIEATDTTAFLKSKYHQDLVARITNYGPHRDDYDFYLDDRLARNHASQGEQRTMILSLIMALGDLIYQIKKERPVFLLDDVFSELDSERQNRLLEYLTTANLQAIVTTTSVQEIKETIIKKAKIFRVTNGYIKEEY